MKSKVKEMEEEAEKLRKIQEQVVQEQEQEGEGGGEEGATDETDERSIYVGQVDYSASPEELQEHFAACGTINRVTILCDRYGQPKVRVYAPVLVAMVLTATPVAGVRAPTLRGGSDARSPALTVARRALPILSLRSRNRSRLLWS